MNKRKIDKDVNGVKKQYTGGRNMIIRRGNHDHTKKIIMI